MTFPELRGPSSSLPAPAPPQSPPQSETLWAVPSLCPLTLPAPLASPFSEVWLTSPSGGHHRSSCLLGDPDWCKTTDLMQPAADWGRGYPAGVSRRGSERSRDEKENSIQIDLESWVRHQESNVSRGSLSVYLKHSTVRGEGDFQATIIPISGTQQHLRCDYIDS